MARTISDSLLAAQRSASRTPYIKVLFTDKAGTTTKDFSTDSTAYGNRILTIDHNEEAYNEYAIIILRDYDSTLPDVTGYWTSIGYGLTTLTSPYNEYAGTQTPRLWVKHQRHVSVGGKLLTILELEGQWAKLKEALLRMGTAPYYQKDYDGSASSVYVILKAVMTEVFGGTNALSASPPDDSIISSLLPIFTINAVPFEYAAGVIYRLIRMTKEFLRNRYGASYPEDTFQCVFPQAADSANETYYSNPSSVQDGFYSFMERKPTLAPNDIIVFYGRNADGTWPSPALYGEATSAADIAKYEAVYRIDIAPDVTTEAMANLLAAAVLARIRAEQDIGLIIVPHDGRVELYDKAAAIDNRGGAVTYPTNTLTRVGGLHHIYQPGRYLLEIYLGGITNNATDEYTADTYIIGKEIAGQKVEVPKPPMPVTPEPFPPWEATPKRPVGIAPIEPTAPPAPLLPPPPPTPWAKLTPWKEEAGETFVSEVSERWRAITPWKEELGETFGTAISKMWTAITPWKEEMGETFISEVRERVEPIVEKITGWVKGWLK